MATPGNEMKWDTTEPSNGGYNFGPGDNIVNFTQSNGMRVRGHNNPDQYLRHYNFELYLNADDGTAQFAQDATFCIGCVNAFRDRCERKRPQVDQGPCHPAHNCPVNRAGDSTWSEPLVRQGRGGVGPVRPGG